MTNKELLEKLQSLTPEQLAQEVDARTETDSFTLSEIYIVPPDENIFEDEAPPVGTVILPLIPKR